MPSSSQEPGFGQIVVKADSREINVQLLQYLDARHALYVEVLHSRELGMDNRAMKIVVTYIAGLPPRKAPVTFEVKSTASAAILAVVICKSPL